MKKIKEYLDYICGPDSNATIELKSNGHYNVQGHWVYPKDYDGNSTNIGAVDYTTPDHMVITLNNEKILCGNMSANGKWSIYHYLDLYEHIPRGEPDINGYYQRCTEEEVIRYLDSYYQQILGREKKIKKIVSKINVR